MSFKKEDRKVRLNDQELFKDLNQDEKNLKRIEILADKLGLSMNEIEEQNLTRRKLKKLLKEKIYDSSIGNKRLIKKQKKVAKKREKVANGTNIPFHYTLMKNSINKLKIVIDLSFESFMTDKRELAKTYKQVSRCYAKNRRSKEPCQFYFTSFKGRIKEEFLKKDIYIPNWDVHFIEEHWYDYFKSTNELSKIIFLTPDSDYTLPLDSKVMTSNRDESIFIIGGLVDHNLHKNLSLEHANSRGVKTAKLPIDEFDIKITGRVLSINQVFEILLEVCSGTDWKESLMNNVPLRKQISEERKQIKKNKKIKKAEKKINNSVTNDTNKKVEEIINDDVTDKISEKVV